MIGVRFVDEAIQIQDKPLLDRAIAGAEAAGLRVVLAVYPYPPREIEAGLASPSLFASYVGVLASIYPQIKHFVIGNEPNSPRSGGRSSTRRARSRRRVHSVRISPRRTTR